MASSSASVRLARAHIQMYASSAASPIQWRLLGGNNRELGRGTGQFIDQEGCVLGIKHLQNVIADLEVSLRRDEAGAWGWLLCLGGVSVAASGFRYDRQIRCRQGQLQFVEALENCEISPNLTLTHARRWAAAHVSTRPTHRDVP